MYEHCISSHLRPRAKMPALIMTLATPPHLLLAICRIHEKRDQFQFRLCSSMCFLFLSLILFYSCSAYVRGRRLAARLVEA
ncbi:hypothetical protein V8C43DRAFT_296041, partial [Trichoderma afarasin]